MLVGEGYEGREYVVGPPLLLTLPKMSWAHFGVENKGGSKGMVG